MSKIIGIGNALVDILTTLENDNLLESLNLPKGSMQLVDLETSGNVLKASKHLSSRFAAGGSASNTIYGLAKLGLETAFIGKIGNDDYGATYRKDLESCNILPRLLMSDTQTGRAIALVSKDSERTFATHLGAAVELTADDLISDHFKDCKYLHIEGYLVQDYELINRAIEYANQHDVKVSLDLSSYNVVEDHLSYLNNLVDKSVNILFANEEEAKSFTGKEPEEAIHLLEEKCEIAIVKIGKKGSLIKSGEQFHKIGVLPANSIDTTGAGDLYASGFLYGLAKGYSLDKCGQIGTLLAGNIIEVIGARIDEERWNNIRDNIDAIVKE